MTRINPTQTSFNPEYMRSAHLVEIPRDEWPASARLSNAHDRILVCNRFFVQVHKPTPSGHVRISVGRTAHTRLRWKDGISWDDLQRMKNEAGFRDHDAVEVYPRESDRINVANLRHLWVCPQPLDFAWRNSSVPKETDG